MSGFDESAARERYRAGLAPGRTSTQSWDVDAWTARWRDDDGGLQPGALGEAGGAWWFRAITDPARLQGRASDVSADRLTAVSARARLAAFIGEANQALVHWPLSALAPAAFALREALGLNEAIVVLAETLPHEELLPFVRWLGPIDASIAERWVSEVADPAVAEEFAKRTDGYARWALRTGREVTLELLEASVDDVDDETFELLATKLMRRRDRRFWEVLAQRPLPALVPRALARIDEPVAPWVFRFFEAGGDETIDALIAAAKGRSKRARAAVRALGQLDHMAVQLRIAELADPERSRLQEALEPQQRDLPELPRAQWQPWMTAVSQRRPAPEPRWLDPTLLPPLATRSGHRLPRAVQDGLLALLQEVRFDVGGDDRLDRYDGALDLLHELLEPRSANAFWNSLFAMWWTNHRPEVRWVMHAAAFLCDGEAIRDLGAKLRRHRKWFGNLSTRVIAALGHNPTEWAVAALFDISSRSPSGSHRELANRFLEQRATRAGVTVDRFVVEQFPDELDPVLIDAAARKLEHAMAEQTPWVGRIHDRAPFHTVAQTTVWRARDEWGVATFFRYDDVEQIDAAGNAVEITDDHIVTVAHPAQMDDALLARWHGHFADHELVQWVEQLERPRYRAGTLSRDGFSSPVGLRADGRSVIRTAQRCGWTAVPRGAHGELAAIERTFEHEDVRARQYFATSLQADGGGEAELAQLVFTTVHGDHLDARDVPVTAFSEVHRDLTRLSRVAR